jgi:hypothetical protein
MVTAEMLLQCIVVDEISRILSAISAIANVAALMSVSAMDVKLIVAIKSPPTKAAFWMSLEASLVDRTGIIITKAFMLAELLLCKQVLLVGEDFLVAGAKIAHDFVVNGFDVAMEIWPSHASHVAARIRAVVSQQQDSIFEDLWLLVRNTKVCVLLREICLLEVLEPLLPIVCEYYRSCFCPTMRTSFRLVECSQSQSTDMTGTVIAGCNTLV